jgi:hypothetical protein
VTHSENEPVYAEVGTPVKIGEVDDPEIRDLLANFESLGADCEFGLVQRRYGAEPSSLLRWSVTNPDVLINLLTNRFAGVGEPTQTQLRQEAWGELTLYDSRYDYLVHSFVHEAGVDREKFLASQCARLEHLTRKILLNLTQGGKIFIYHALSLEHAGQIHRLMRSYGDNATMFVHLADDQHASGEVVDRGEGRLDAYISRYGATKFADGGGRWFIDFEAWVAICRASLRLQ